MTTPFSKQCLLILCALAACIVIVRLRRAQQGFSRAGFSNAELREFQSIEPIDVHTHILKSDPAFNAMLEQLHLHVLNIFVGAA